MHCQQIYLKIILVVTVMNRYISAKNILFVNLVPSPSHHIWNEALIEGLLMKEHNVTMIGFYPSDIKRSNYTILKIDVAPFLDSVDSVLKDVTESTSITSILSMWTFTKMACQYNLKSKEFQTLLKYPKKIFDLLIFDITFSECYLPLIDHFGKQPSVVVTPFGLQSYINDIIGERIENYIPYYAFPYTDQMSFFERLHSFFYITVERLSRWYYLKELDEMNKIVFGENIRWIQELERDISLVFPNDDPILEYPKPSSPNVIPIGGVHIKTPQKLDKNLQTILDESKDGVIFASLGSNFQPKHYADHVKKAFVDAFSKLNVTVLWRFDDVEASKNVIVRKWFPQSDILAHPNTKLFITHCGALSSQETIIRGVPVIGIPLFHDQFFRAGKFNAIKGGIILDYWDLSSDHLYKSIVNVLRNTEYKENVLTLSSLYKNQPQRPLEKFLIWIGYILKSGHLNHLSTGARRMRWYQVDSWDIFGFIAAIILIVIVLIKSLCCYLDSKIFCNKQGDKKQKMH